MKKIVKWILILAAIVISIVLIAAICLKTFVNPNKFKPFIITKVSEYTGRQLAMDGDVSWTLFPSLGMKVGHVVLSNPPEFQQKVFAEIEKATVVVKLLPLLSNKVESNGITIDGMKLNLIRDVKGNTNWHFQSPQKTVINNAASNPLPESSRTQKDPLMISILAIDINNAIVTWTDEQKKQTADIKNGFLHAKNISTLNPFPVSLEFDFSTQNEAASGHIKLLSQTSMNVAAKIYTLRDIDLTAAIRQSEKKYSVKIAGDVTADLNSENLQWNHFQGKIDNTTITGKMSVSELMTAPNATGDFKVDSIEINKVKITNVVIPLHYQKGILDISSMTGGFYQGTLQGNAKMDFNSASPTISLNTKAMNFQIEPLLKDLGASNSKLSFTGTGNVDWQITSVGSARDAVIKNLNGKGHLSLNKGVLEGMDIVGLINAAYSMIKTKTLPALPRGGQTDFGNLTGSFVIQNGVITNNDLLFITSQMTTKGQGTINLVSNEVNFHLQAVMNTSATAEKKELFNLYGIAVPIVIDGQLQNPKIGLDVGALAKIVAEQELQKMQKKLKGNIPAKANDLLKNLLGQ